MKKIHGIQSIFLKYVLTLLAIAMALSGIVIGTLLGRNVSQATVSQYTYVNDRIAVLLQNEYARTDDVMKRCLESAEIQDSLRNGQPDSLAKEKLELMLSYADLKYLETYVYVDNKENLYLQAYRNTSYEKLCASGLKEALGDEYSKTRWIWTKDRVFDREGNYLFIGRYMRNMEFHHGPGMLFFQINEGIFQNILKDASQEDGICMILDTNGRLCYRTHKDSYELSDKQLAKLRQSELSSLMYQINPHFLYNTLDTIYMLARMNGEEITMKMIQALSKFMKVSLSKGSDVISVADELEHVKSYVEIQKIRNADLFQYEIRCEEHLKQAPVLKLILQPLVENAIKHGFAKIYQDGNIDIRVWQDDQELVFEIENNGEQMKAEVIELIQMMVKEDLSAVRGAFRGQESGYGIGNVISRLRLKYEDRIAFYYTSEENGTCCTIRIPLQEPEKSG